VDDGSTDDSLAILQYYQKKDDRVQVIHQENRYAGVARNEGLKHATGKYVIFWDGDDYFKTSALKKLYDQAEADNAEITVCGAHRYDEEMDSVLSTEVYLKMEYVPEQRPFSRKDIGKYLFNFTTNVPWNKLFLRSFIQEHQLQFHACKQANDMYFVMMALFYAEKITVVDRKPLYYRVNNSSSLTGKASETELCVYEEYKKVQEQLKNDERYNSDIHQSFVNKALSGLIVSSLGNQRNVDSYRRLYDLIRTEGLAYFDILGHEQDYFYAQWQYKEAQNMQHMELDEFLHTIYLRERNNANRRRTRIRMINRERAAQLEEKDLEIEMLNEKIAARDKRLNSKTVKMAYRLKKIVTLNGLLLKLKSLLIKG
jgi:glycosyltransferase involved in cell wall biosynthesis